MKVWKKFFSFLTIVAYGSTSMVSPAWAVNTAQELETVRHIYQTTKSTYAKTGNKTAITGVMAQDFSKKDLEFVLESLPESDLMPTVTVRNSEFLISSKGFKDIRFKAVDAANGKFQVNGINFEWKPNESFKKNIDRLLPIVKAEGLSWHRILLNILLPSAHAEDAPEEKSSGWSEKTVMTTVIAAAAVIVVGLLAVLLYKNAQEKRKTELKREEIKAKYSLEQFKAQADHEARMAENAHMGEEGGEAPAEGGGAEAH